MPSQRVDPGAGGPLEVQVSAALAPDRLPPLVFLHEGLGSVGLWRDFPDRVRRAAGGPATVVYSRHGHGRSAGVTLPRPITYMHDEADAVLPSLLDHLGVDAPILVGHSDGASIALLYAGAGRPVTALVLIAPHVFVEDITVSSIADAKVAYETTDLRDRMARHHDDVDTTFRGWNDVWLSPGFRSWNIEERLPSIRCPVLLIQGDGDPYGTLAQLDAIERGVAGTVRRLVVRGAQHAPHLEAPHETLDEVVRFIGEVTGRRHTRAVR